MVLVQHDTGNARQTPVTPDGTPIQMEWADYLIIGAGCAGLSLAVYLVEAGMTNTRIVLIDSRTTFANDRTWCYWNVFPHYFESAVSYRWRKWNVIGTDGTTTATSARYAYHHITARDFYTTALNRLQRASNVEIRLGQPVCTVRAEAQTVRVETGCGVIYAGYVFDSRPRPYTPPPRGRDSLIQHFGGAIIHTKTPVFAPDTVSLMDFRVPQDTGIHFMYILPYTPDTALVEATYFSARPFPQDVYETAIHRYMQATCGAIPYSLTPHEYGSIPMSIARPATPAVPRVYTIGVAGGATKPSTGYSFMTIQRSMAALAQQLVRDGRPEPPATRGRKEMFLDGVFLSYIQRRPQKVPTTFWQLFARSDPDTLVRFLSDAGSLSDCVRIALTLPIAPFLLEACRSFPFGRVK